MSTPPFPETAKARGRVGPTKFAHTVLRTSPERFPTLVAWYKTVLECVPAFENPFISFMTYDEEHHRVAIAALPGLQERPANAIGLDHLAFTYAGLPELVHTYERLLAEDIAPSTAIHHGPTLSLYYLDPDRNQVELLIDVLTTPEALAEFFASGQFSSNPIGVLFDMDELCKRFHEGEPVEELIRPIEGPLPGPDAFAEH